jgi:hypothetical protein
LEDVCALIQLIDLELGQSLDIIEIPDCFINALTQLQSLRLPYSNFVLVTRIQDVLVQLSPLNLTVLDLSHDSDQGSSLLSGVLPENIAQLFPYMEELTLEYIPLNVPNPVPLPSLMPINLQWLHLGSTNIGGSLPSSWNSMKGMRSLDLSRNMLSGILPSNLFEGWTELTQLYLFGNANSQGQSFSGPFPSLSDSIHMQMLQISMCRGTQNTYSFTGSLPAGMERMYELYHIEMGCAGFHGEMPWSALAQSSGLAHLSFPSNFITGPIPENNAWTQLGYLDATGNMLGGSLPSSLARNPLTTILLRGCNLTGDIPVHWSSMQYVEYMDLSSNRLTGWPGVLTADAAIWPPSQVPAFPVLQYLNVSANHMSGEAWFHTLLTSPQLMQLDVSDNQFTLFGMNYECPWAVFNITYLDTLSPIVSAFFSHNRLTEDLVSQLLTVLTVWALGGTKELSVLTLADINFTICPPLIAGINEWTQLCNHSFVQKQSLIQTMQSILLKLPDHRPDLLEMNQKYDLFNSSCTLPWPLISSNQIAFPRLVSLDASNNPIGVALPPFSIPTTTKNLRLVQSASVRNCSLGGSMSNDIGYIQLMLMDANPDMRSKIQDQFGKYILPSFATLDPYQTVSLTDQHLECMTIVGTGSHAISMDSAYLHFQQCMCAPGLAWLAEEETCMVCPPHVLCDSNVFRPIHRVQVGSFPLTPSGQPFVSSGWPVHSDELANYTEIDPLWLFDATILGCDNYPAVCTSFNENDSLSSVAIYSCADGHDPTSLQCAACLNNYFLLGSSDCIECPKWARWPIIICTALVFVAFLYYLHGQAKQNLFESNDVGSAGATFLLVTVWLQTLNVLTDVGVRAPSHWSLDIVSRLSNFSPLAWECISPQLDGTGQFILIAALIFFLLFLTAVCGIIRATKWQQVGFLLLFFLYTPGAKQTLTQLRYESVDILGPTPRIPLTSNPSLSVRQILFTRYFLTWIPNTHTHATHPADILLV